MTATATIRAEVREGNDWLRRRFATLVERLNNVVHGSHPSAGCVRRIGDEGATVTLPRLNPWRLSPRKTPNPGLGPRYRSGDPRSYRLQGDHHGPKSDRRYGGIRFPGGVWMRCVRSKTSRPGT
jgi:hypothetical protein